MHIALHMAQYTFDNLLQIAFALSQISVVHFVELARHDIELRSQRPFGVVETVFDPVGDAIGQHLVLQEHQMHFQNRAELGGRVFGQGVVQLL